MGPTFRRYGCGVIAALGIIVMLGCGRLDPFKEEYDHYRENAKAGMTEEDVRSRLGEPQYEYTKESAPADYYVGGWEHKKRDISHKVLIYQKGEPICYVWIDATGKVEDVFVGGS